MIDFARVVCFQACWGTGLKLVSGLAGDDKALFKTRDSIGIEEFQPRGCLVMRWGGDAPNKGNMAKTIRPAAQKKTGARPVFLASPQDILGLHGAEKLLLLGDCGDLGLAEGPLAGKGLQVVQALEQVCAQRGDRVALVAMAEQAGGA